MATQTNFPFSWDKVDKLSDLSRLRLILDTLPDADIINALEQMRKNGRNNYTRWRRDNALNLSQIKKRGGISS